MKKILTAFTAIVAISLLISSCKRESVIDPNTVRLLKVQSNLLNGDVITTQFNYDGSGRIVSVSAATNAQAPIIFLNISYNGNEAIISRPKVDNAGVTLTDTIILTLDPNKRVIRRIQKEFHEFKSPANIPQRTYLYDTINYEYNGSGVLTREIIGNWDSTWFNPGPVSILTTRLTGTNNHTITAGNVVSVAKIVNRFHTQQNPSGSTSSSGSTETNGTYFYRKAYPNQTDFNNAAVLNEVNFLTSARVSSAYANLPEKYTEVSIDKNQAGVEISRNESTMNAILTYNYYGFLSTIADPSSPSLKKTFIYSK